MVNFTPLLPAEDGAVIGDHKGCSGNNNFDDVAEDDNSQGYAEEGGRDDEDSAQGNELFDENDEYLLDPKTSYKTHYETYRYPDKAKTLNVTYKVDPSKFPDTDSRLMRSIYYEDVPSRYTVRTRYANSSIDANQNKCPKNNFARNISQSPPSSPCRSPSPPVMPSPASAIPFQNIPVPQIQQMPHMRAHRRVDLRGATNVETLDTAHESLLRYPDDSSRKLDNQNATSHAAGGEEFSNLVMKRDMSPPASRSGPSPTGRGPSASSPSRCSSPARPRSSLPPVPRPPSSVLCRSGEESDPSPKRQLFLKYSYIPAWVFLARRNHKFFLQILDYYFGHADWPDFDKLPENFRTLCYRNDIRRNHAKKMPGFAPVWMFLLRRLDERYFMAAVDHFFEQRMFPNWDWLQENLALTNANIMPNFFSFHSLLFVIFSNSYP